MEDPQLWRWAVIRVEATNLGEVLASNRVRAVRSLLYDGGGRGGGGENARITTDNLRLILNFLLRSDFVLKSLKMRTFLENNSENSSLLAQIVCQVEEVDLQELQLRCDLVTFSEVFSQIATTQNIKLKSLNITGVNLLGVWGDSLSKAVNRIEEVKMSGVRMLPEQLHNILNIFLAGGSFLKSLDLSRAINIPLERHLLSQTVANLVEVNLSDVGCPMLDINALLSDIIERDRSQVALKKLLISGIDVSHVSSTTLSEVASRLESLGLSRTNLLGLHVTELFSRITGATKLRLKELDIGGNNLHLVRKPDILAKVVSRLINVNLWRTNLNQEQIKCLFEEIIKTETLRLRSLNISQNDLSSLSPAVFSQAVSRLEEVRMFKCRIAPTASSYGSYSLPHHDCYFQQLSDSPGNLRVLLGNFSLSHRIIGKLSVQLYKFSHSFL